DSGGRRRQACQKKLCRPLLRPADRLARMVEETVMKIVDPTFLMREDVHEDIQGIVEVSIEKIGRHHRKIVFMQRLMIATAATLLVLSCQREQITPVYRPTTKSPAKPQDLRNAKISKVLPVQMIETQ